ncbi:hypothetical protein ACPOL_6829 (plasmid) [Acidisarcina polymorpha]|uniref:Uncharacterized protein n=1 Tax=Acidisarcina polymorpha TaxID=2211140 RepID=A0A2Z5GAK8_9BACT|nr:hypothetical protein ACPOL_6829 [Acidisarcina polymorpha]
MPALSSTIKIVIVRFMVSAKNLCALERMQNRRVRGFQITGQLSSKIGSTVQA